jgi:SAM-dependent methyltransferase
VEKRVSQFFDRNAEDYYDDPRSHPMAPFHIQTADRLQRNLQGSVLCVGGLWDLADLSKTRGTITVTDVSRGMLRYQAEDRLRRVVNDGRCLAFASGSFDHVVLPLVLHHIAGSSARSARENVRRVLAEVSRVLRRGGRVWISELCPPSAVYAAELAAAPLTRGVLGLARVPFVVMHSPGFYRRALEALAFRNVTVDRVRSEQAKATDWLEPVLGMPWLRVPRFMFPVNATVISAER